jgi:glycosyltransferase involved in cell wall biosynthesis
MMGRSDGRIKVVRLLPTLDFGGVESRAILQAGLLDRERFDLRVCTFWRDGEAGAKIRALGVPVDVLDVDPSVRNPNATLALWHYLHTQRPDVLHASISEAMFHGAWASYAAGVPLRIIEEVGRPTRSQAGHVAFAAISMLVNRVVGVSQITCDYLIKEDRMAAERVRLIYNCGKPEYFAQPPVERLRAPDAPLRIFTAGRLVPVKNHSALLDVMAELVLVRGLNVRLEIAGDGPLREELAARIRALGLSAHVMLLGFRDDIRALLDASDVFVLPSFDEGCSVALIEAMASGILVVGSTAGGILEVLGELSANYAIPASDIQGWADVLERIYHLPAAARHTLGQQARHIAEERFSPARYIKNLEDMYMESRRATR